MLSHLKVHFSTIAESRDKKSIIIVSGLPRSGTSMMMKMLAAARIEVLTDNRRAADDDNPEGYFEFERVKKLREGDCEWLDQAKGKAVKVVSALLEFLPRRFRYEVIFMRREMSEILASQRKMLTNRGNTARSVDDATMTDVYEKHLDTVMRWLSREPNFRVLQVEYNRLLLDPVEDLGRLTEFLNLSVDVEGMQAVIDKSLYRQRS